VGVGNWCGCGYGCECGNVGCANNVDAEVSTGSEVGGECGSGADA
jgi:hypothetical protein